MPRLKLRSQDLERLKVRRLLALKRAEEVCRYLCQLGAKESYIFGSLLTENFHEHSDIDLAVLGLPRTHIYRVESKIEEILGGLQFDLVYLENAPAYLAQRIKAHGKRYACDFS